MYVDFKNRVVEGRGVHPEVIDLIAGGRVFTGLKAFSLTAPPELIRKIRGLDSETVTLPISDVLAIEPTAPVEGLVATISEDQETSPFAPPVSTDASTPNEPFIPTVLESISTATATTAAIADLSTSVSAPVSSQIEEGSVLGKVAGEYEIVAGAFGKGIIDGLGGIRDSAVYACELYVSVCSPLVLRLPSFGIAVFSSTYGGIRRLCVLLLIDLRILYYPILVSISR